MYLSKAWCDLWHVASVLNISITANTTRIILWNFLEIYNFHYMVRSRWIKWLTFLFHVSLIVDIFFRKMYIGKEGDWMALGRVRRLFLLNLIGCHVLHDVRPRLHGLYGLYGPRCPLSPERPFNLITHSLAQDIQNFHGVEDIILYQHLNNVYIYASTIQ